MTVAIPTPRALRSQRPARRPAPRLLLALGGRGPAAPAIAAARLAAARLGAEPQPVTVVDSLPVYYLGSGLEPLPPELVSSRRALARERLQRELDEAAGGRCAWGLDLFDGPVARTLARVAAEREARLVVMGIGRHAPLDRLLGEELTLQTLRLAPCPVLAVADGWTTAPRRAVVAVDFSPASIRAAEVALALLEDGGTLTLVHARPPFDQALAAASGAWVGAHGQRLAELLDRLRAALSTRPGVAIRTEVVAGEPAGAVLAVAARLGAELVATGSTGRGFFTRMVVGSVATRILRTSPVSVLAVPTPSAEETDRMVPEGMAGDEIIVTARKREENIQEVPIAVTVTSGEVLEDTAAPDISVLQSYVPNLSIYQGRNQTTTLTAFMRGIGQADPLWGVDPGVGLYLDDVYMARPQGALLDVYDVERVEVLRGPQGTLYGKNTIGGAIKYVSRPPTDDLRVQASLTGGSYGTQEVRALVSGPIVEGTLRGKLAVASLQRDGYGENLFTGRDVSDKDSLAFRLGLDWLPVEDVVVSFSADRTEDDAEPKGYQRLAPNQFCPLLLGAPCPPLADRYDTQSGLAPLNSTDSEGYGLTVSWDLAPAWQLKSVTAFRESDSENNIDFDTTPARIVDVQATYYDEQTSQELQLIYDGGGKLDGVVGAFWFDGEAGGLVKNIFLNGINPVIGFGTTNGRTFTESIALFGEGSYEISERLTFNLGLRGTRETKRGIAFNASYTNDTFSVIRAIAADYDKEETFTSVAPRIGVDYRFSDDVMGYVTASRGFKSGGFNVRASAVAFPASAEPFDDEILDVVEVGVKSVLADRQLVLNTAVFYGEYTDIQVSTFTAFDSNGDGTEDAFFGNFLNAGDATMKGLEVEYDFTPAAARWFGVQGFVSWLEAEPDDFLDANRDGFVDTQVITNAPEWTGSLRLRFNHELFGGVTTAVLAGNYRDDSVLTNEGGADPRFPPPPSPQARPLLPLSQDAYTTYDASLAWFSGDGRWGVKVNGYNLTDEEFITNGYNIPALGVVTGSYGTPRTVTAGLEFKLF